MEEEVAVGVGERHRERRQRVERGRQLGARAVAGEARERAVVRALAGDQHLDAVVLGLDGDADRQLDPVRHGDPLQQADPAQPGELASGRGDARCLGHQLHRAGEREHRLAVDAVVGQVAVVGDAEAALEAPRVGRCEEATAAQERGKLAIRAGGGWRAGAGGFDGCGRRGRAEPLGGADHDLGLTGRAALELVDQHPRAGGDVDQRDAAPGELLLERRRHADAGPGAPVDREHAGRPGRVELAREPGERLAGRGVVGLAAVAEAAGHGAEQAQEAQALGPQPLGQRPRRTGLRGDDAAQRVERLVGDQPILDHARAVDHAVEPAVAGVDALDQRAERVGVGDVAGQVLGARPSPLHPGEVLARLADAQDRLDLGLDQRGR